MLASITTNFPGGVTNARDTQTMGESAVPDPTFAQQWWHDFNTLNAADLTITLVGTGTTALTPDPLGGGVLLATTTAAAPDANYYQVPVASFVITPLHNLFFKARLKMSDVITNTVFAGLIATSATPLAAADGVFFVKSPGAATWLLRVVTAGTTVDTPLPSSLLAVAATFLEVGFFYDGQGNIAAFFNPTTGLTQPQPNSPRGYVAVVSGVKLPSVPLAPSFGILNGSAAARTLSVDFIVTTNER